jgi:hypothetical protein
MSVALVTPQAAQPHFAKELFMVRRFPFLMVTVASLLACSSDADSGSAPVVKDFTLTPTDLTVGKTTEINGRMTIEDADGDIAGASGEVVFPDGKVVPIQDVSLAAGSAKSIPVDYKIPALPVPLAGDYTVSVRARDQKGNQSAKASFKLIAK